MIDASGGNKLYYYHYDGVGSVAALSDVNNVVVERYRYDVFGGVTIRDSGGNQLQASDVDNPFMFTGRQYDSKADFYYYRARYYAPKIGRFLQTDPIGYSDGMNMYTYCGNNPVNWADPYGLCKGDSRGFWKKAWDGDYVGTQYGNSSLDYYAQKIASGNAEWYDYAGGFFSALWTPESWKETTLTLATAGAGSEVVGAKSAGQEAAVIGKSAKSAIFKANKISGKSAELKLLTQYGGKGNVFKQTSIGRRYIDNLSKGIAREAKVGKVALKKSIKQQIAKDVELLNKAGSGVNKVEWHFFRSAKTGVGPTRPLTKALTEAGFDIIVH